MLTIRWPLSDVFRHARRMEQAAKYRGRDSLGIALFKHSGNISEVVTQWEYADLNVLAISKELVKLLHDDDISKRFLYTFRDTVKKLIEDNGKLISGSIPLVKEEFNRLIEGAYKTKGKQLEEANQTAISQTVALLSFIKPFTNFIGFLENC